MDYNELIRTDGGFTVRPYGGQVPTKGYFVALQGLTDKTPVQKFSDLHILFFADKVSDLIDWTDPNFFIGGWLNKGTVYLDVSELVLDRETAIRLGQKRNQIAIWDIANCEEILTNGTGE
jgi:hypothetical protein